MTLHYGRVAGQSLERLAALSDGIFAVAMTLLALDLRVPAHDAALQLGAAFIWTPGALQAEISVWNLLAPLWPRFLTYLMSFLTLGIFWLGQQAQLATFERGSRGLAWVHIAFLCAVTLMPFSTSFLAEYIGSRLAIGVYWLNLLLLGVMLFASLTYGERTGLLKESATDELRALHKRRIVVYQSLYAVCFGLGAINPYLGIVLLILAQIVSLLPRLSARPN
ncbi:MAG TPA: TMEM175 family protein [Chloroflexota bacterium]|nr:TMEM175 family protein [Chloroflexota bacterium]